MIIRLRLVHCGGLFWLIDWQEDDDITEVGDQDEWMNAKTMVKPEDQLQLTETVSILR